jgi:hypothetical protein
MAAIHTDTHPLSNVRGKCYVRHKDRIDNLLAWKKMPDHFYFTKFFDPYIKREYEVLRTESVQNSESVKWSHANAQSRNMSKPFSCRATSIS